MADRETLLKILDLARWAPSGDNTQPWRFEIVSDDHIAIHGHDTREWCLYDFDGHASHMAHGALLETLRIAATKYRLAADWSLREGTPDTAPVYDVRLVAAHDLTEDPLSAAILTRAVQRRPMSVTPLSEAQHAALVAAPGPGFRVDIFGESAMRRRIARLLWTSAGIRLTCPEAYEVHKEIIEWGARFSEDRIPERAVGVDVLTGRLMRWVLASWSRVDFFNRYLFGTVLPRLQLDYLTGLRCAAHVLLRPEKRLDTVTDYVQAGVAMQRLWLTATTLGLSLQPQMTPVIFRWYARRERVFTANAGLQKRAASMADEFEAILGMRSEDDFAFFGRVGGAPMPASRSVRRTVDGLMRDQG